MGNRKIILFFSLFILIVVLLLVNTIFSYVQARQSIKSRVTLSTSETIGQAAQNVDSLLSSYEQMSNSIILNPLIRRMIDIIYDPKSTTLQATDAMNQIGDLLTSSKSSNSFTERVVMRNVQGLNGHALFDRNMATIVSKPSNYIMFTDENNRIMNSVVEKKGDMLWLPSRERSIFSPVNSTLVSTTPLITLGRSMRNLSDSHKEFSIFIEIKIKALSSIFEQLKIGEDGELYVLDAQNRIIYSKNMNRMGQLFPMLMPIQTSGVLELTDLERLLIFDTSHHTGWKIVGILSTTTLFADIQKNVLLNLGAVSLIVCLLILAGVLFRKFWSTHIALQASVSEIHRKNTMLSLQYDELQTNHGELTRLNLLKDHILANTSHELRTPLHSINGFAESILEDHNEKISDKVRDHLIRIVKSGNRLNGLVNDILDLSKWNKNEYRLYQRPVSLLQVVDEAITSMQGMVLQNAITIRRVFQETFYVIADYDRLLQVFQNLLSNAIKFTEHGEITVHAMECDDGKIEIAVKDTGIGIPSQWLERIFEPFVQVDGSEKRKYSGTGLGLSIVKSLVIQHGGQIHVQSQIDQGSEFKFTLFNVDRISNDLKEIDITSRPLPNAVKLALIVDDEENNRLLLQEQLVDRNWQVLFAENGKKALQLLEITERVDLILLDVMMPGMNGYDVCEKIRQAERFKSIPIILITDKNQVSDWVRGFESGANDFMTKPFSKTELLSRVALHTREIKTK